jgi:sugar fermentation stimulation protein A
MGIRFPDPLVPARFLRRLNRFAALVELNGTHLRVHVRIQRRDAHSFTPHHEADPAFAAALIRAARAGVQVLAMRCRVSRRGVALEGPVPIRWPPAAE